MEEYYYDRYIELLCRAIVDDKHTDADAESIASLDYTSEALRSGVNASERFKIACKFRRRARTEGIIK